MAPPLDPLARMVFVEHCELRWTERFGGPLPHEAARGEIRSALLGDRWATEPPAWIRLGRPRLPSVFAWTPDEARCWVLHAAPEGVLLIDTVCEPIRGLDDARLRPSLVRR